MPTKKLRSVLYVDDDPDICAIVQATLSRLGGLDVHVASSGEIGIDFAYELRPDLILMDVMMPGLDGPSTFKRMRESAVLADTPVIFLTAKVLPAEVTHFLQLGAIGVIGKPFDPAKLCDDVLAMWGNMRAARTSIVAGSGDPIAVQTKADSLALSFLRRASSEVERLREALGRVRLGDTSACLQAERIAHSLHGSAAMFGFPNVSASGGAIEHLLESARTGVANLGSMDGAGVLRQLFDRTEQLARELESAGSTGG